MLVCVIMSSQKIVSYNDLHSVVLPSLSGEIEILSDYAESFLFLKEGNVVLNSKVKNKKFVFFVKNAICHVKDNFVKIIL